MLRKDLANCSVDVVALSNPRDFSVSYRLGASELFGGVEDEKQRENGDDGSGN